MPKITDACSPPNKEFSRAFREAANKAGLRAEDEHMHWGAKEHTLVAQNLADEHLEYVICQEENNDFKWYATFKSAVQQELITRQLLT